MYVGSSYDIAVRWSQHRSDLQKGIHHSPYLQNAWNLYGESAFEFSVIEECPIELLLEREQHYMDQCSDRYNINPAAGSRLGASHTPETKAKISASLMGNTYNAGHVASLEAREKMRQSAMGNQYAAGHVASPESRAKMSEAQRGNTNRVGHVTPHETREKISASLKGNKNATGTVPSLETRERLSAAMMGNTNGSGRTVSAETREKLSASHMGHEVTPETRSKISEANKAAWARKREEKAAD